MWPLFTSSATMGLLVAMPVGPIGILCMNRSLRYGFASGILTGLGSAIADGLYCYAAVYGLAQVSALPVVQEQWLKLFGASLLLLLGLQLLRAHHSIQREGYTSRLSLSMVFTSAFLITFIDPLTILPFTAMLARFGSADIHIMQHNGLELVLGVTCGAMLWWGLVSSVCSSLKHQISDAVVRTINTLSACVLFGYAFSSLY